MKINSLLLSYCAGYVCEARMVGDNCEVNTEVVMQTCSLVPRPSPSFPSLAVPYFKRRKTGRGLGMRLAYMYMCISHVATIFKEWPHEEMLLLKSLQFDCILCML